MSKDSTSSIPQASGDAPAEEPSPLLRTLQADMSEDDMWEEMTAAERLPVILDHFLALEWFGLQALPTLAIFRQRPAGKWGMIKARFKDIGGNPFDLEKEVDKLLQAARAQESPPASAPVDRPRFQTISARDLYAKELPPQQWIVPDILPTGAALFTGRGKDGKSLLAWNLCLAVATGGTALGRYEVQQGDVLYQALEDGERRAQKRLHEQMQSMGNEAPPERLELVLWDTPRIGDGFEERLMTWLDEHPEARLVVIDILEKVRPKRQRAGSVYADDYAAIAPLQRLAQEHNIAVMVIHHSNKTKPDDFRDTASGSMGLIGACDTFWSLQRIAGAPDAALHIIGRDVEAQELAMRFDAGFWTVLGDAEAYRVSKASKAVLEALQTVGKPQAPKQLADTLGTPEGTMRKHLKRMLERGEVLNIGDGRYIPRAPLPPTSSSLPTTTTTRERGNDKGCHWCH